jgi:hypothetical protein
MGGLFDERCVGYAVVLAYAALRVGGGGSRAMRGRLWRYRWLLLGVAVVCAGVVVFLAWPSGRRLPPPRARVYTQFDACLLTDSNGVSGPAAAPVWAGMQAASLQTSGKVSFLAVYGADTAANAVPYVNTLVQRRCDLVIAVGAAEVAAVRNRAQAFPGEHFVVVDPGPSGGNVTAVPSSPDNVVSSTVQNLVTRAARS